MTVFFISLMCVEFTKSRSSKVKAKGTFRGIVEKIPYLKELGITTLEFMPAYEFDEAYRFPQFIDSSKYLRYGVIKGSIYNNTVTKKAEKLNCWGYTRHFIMHLRHLTVYQQRIILVKRQVNIMITRQNSRIW